MKFEIGKNGVKYGIKFIPETEWDIFDVGQLSQCFQQTFISFKGELGKERNIEYMFVDFDTFMKSLKKLPAWTT